MIYNVFPKDLQLNKIVSRIQNLVPYFQSPSFFHTLRCNNSEANLEANMAVSLNSRYLVSGVHMELVDPLP